VHEALPQIKTMYLCDIEKIYIFVRIM